MGKFRGSAQNSAFCAKLWSLSHSVLLWPADVQQLRWVKCECLTKHPHFTHHFHMVCSEMYTQSLLAVIFQGNLGYPVPPWWSTQFLCRCTPALEHKHIVLLWSRFKDRNISREQFISTLLMGGALRTSSKQCFANAIFDMFWLDNKRCWSKFLWAGFLSPNQQRQMTSTMIYDKWNCI